MGGDGEKIVESWFVDATSVEALRAHLEALDDWIGHLEMSFAGSKSELETVRARCAEQERELEQYRGVRSYRVAVQLDAAAGRIAPPGSLRRRLLRIGYRRARAVPRLRLCQYVAHQGRVALGRAWALLDLVARRTTDPPFEVIEADDASTAKTRGLIEVRADLAHPGKETNLGRIGSCNRSEASRLLDPSVAAGAARGRILVIDHRLPLLDEDCASVRMYEIIRAIRRRGHHVSFVPDDMARRAPKDQLLQGIGVEVIYRPYYHTLASFLGRHGSEFDLVVLSRASIAIRHMFTVKWLAPRAKVVFDTVDLHFVREEREADLKQDPTLREKAGMRKRAELQLARWADLTLVVSPVEREILRRESPGLDVRILSTIYAVGKNDHPGPDARRTIVFIGGYEHLPNVDAVLYFAREIFPLVKERIPDAVFQVIGPSAPPAILELAASDIEILGCVPDVEPHFDRARLSVAPIRFGAGVKGKVSQSMALGVPAVVTSIAAEGMYLEHGQNAMIADDPARFAEAVVQVWSSPELWWRLSENGLKTVQEHFSVESATDRVDELLAWAGLHAGDREPAGWSVGAAGLAASPHH